MSFLRFLRAGALALAPLVTVSAQGVLEIPAPQSYQSGIGVISGWQCSGQRIEISINGGPLILAGSHTPRDDAAGICGRSDTGFSVLFNWNILPPTECCEIGGVRNHRVVAYADGVPFADSKFYVAKFGYYTEYLTGRSGTYVLRNFPDPGTTAQISWDQDKQNFTINKADGYWTPTYPELGGSGSYYGGVQVYDCSGNRAPPVPTTRTGKFVVKTESGQMQLRLEYADGNICQLPSVQVNSGTPRLDGHVKARFGLAATSSCADFAGKVVDISVNGRVLEGSTASGCTTNFTGATFKP